VRIGAFQLSDTEPEFNEPYAFAIIRPWIDVNGVGTMVMRELEGQFGARELATLKRPGSFFDFTRYRPNMKQEGGIRTVTVPNVTVKYARRETGRDFLFLDLLEPHAFAEAYVESILKLLKTLGVRKYILLGSMSDVVPHTRPLIVYGGAAGTTTLDDLRRSGTLSSSYQGPTTMPFLINQRGPEFGIDTIWFIASLPQYVVVDEDYIGKLRLMEILNTLYDIPVDKGDFERALEERRLINERIDATPELRGLIPQLETIYDERIRVGELEDGPKLTSEMEEILWKAIGKDLGKA
jgi:hypothetical protein